MLSYPITAATTIFWQRSRSGALMAEIHGKRTAAIKEKAAPCTLPCRSQCSCTPLWLEQACHSVGVAFAQQYRKEKGVTVCLFGDGAADEGSFHEALTWRACGIFPLSSSAKTICMPRSALRGAYRVENIADRAVAYAMPGLIVDGNDVLAVYDATSKQGTRRCRAGRLSSNARLTVSGA